MGSFDFFRREKDVRNYRAGDVIFSVGDAGDTMFAVVDGEVEIRSGDRVLETVCAGDIFGEMGLIDQSPRSADAVARTDCTVAAITQKRFMFLIQQTPFFAIDVMRLLSERVRRRTPG